MSTTVEYCKRCGYKLSLQGSSQLYYKKDGYCAGCRIAIHDMQFKEQIKHRDRMRYQGGYN